MPSSEPHVLMIVDDDPDILRLLKMAAERSNTFGEIMTAESGNQAIERLLLEHDTHHSLPNIILTDLKMPRQDGLQFARTLQNYEHTKDIPVVMMSSSDYFRDRDAAMAVGCRAFMPKPSDFAGLKQMMVELSGLCQPSAKGAIPPA